MSKQMHHKYLEEKWLLNKWCVENWVIIGKGSIKVEPHSLVFIDKFIGGLNFSFKKN